MTGGAEPSRLLGLQYCPRRVPIGEGGQGIVFAFENDPWHAIKVFRRPRPELSTRMRHLAVIVKLHAATAAGGWPLARSVAWPSRLIMNEAGEVGGYLMHRYGPPEHQPITALFTQTGRQAAFPGADWRFLAGVARNLAAVLAELHKTGFVVGDLKPDNIVIDPQGYVTLLDSDSMQFTDPSSGQVFASTAQTWDYAPPELQATDFPRSPYTDNFSLAVLILQLLLCGDHPFDGRPDDGSEVQRRDNIRHGRSHLTADGKVRLPKGAVEADVLPPRIRALAVEALLDGHLDPRKRPAPARWFAELLTMTNELTRCPVGHAYSPSHGQCPWCARLVPGVRDRFGKIPAHGVRGPDAQPSVTKPPPPSGQVRASPVQPVATGTHHARRRWWVPWTWFSRRQSAATTTDM